MKLFQAALFASSMLVPAMAQAAPLAATALPTGPVVVAGQATVSRSPAALVVNETSGKAILNWRSFDIGSAASVTFVQPSASAMVLNRVLGADPSRIDGTLRSNGQIILINPNGLVFGGGATVDVGGIVASTLDISNADFLRGDLRFERNGPAAAVVNDGSIRAAKGGYVALLGSQLANRGMIQANFGTVAMAAGDRVTMTMAGASLVGVSVDPAAVRTQIDQGGAVVAGDGGVWLTAKAQSALLGGAINATGSIEANSLTARGGAIVLDATGPITLAGADFRASGALGGGVIRIGGLDNASAHIGQGSALDASATVSGAGGFIETSGQSLDIGAAIVRTAGAGGGAAGAWLLDPYDLTIDQTAAATISTALGVGGVTIMTSASSSAGAGVVNTAGVGDIIVAAPIAWAADTVLTLDAYHGVSLDAALTASGAAAGLVIITNNGGSGGLLTVRAPVTMPATASVTINSTPYTLINSSGGLQAIGSTGAYALVGTVTLTGGFTPLGGAGFTGVLEGFGNTISGLTVNGSARAVGMFSSIGAGGRVENLVMTAASVTQGAGAGPEGGQSGVGILAGESTGTIYNTSSAGVVVAGSYTATASIKVPGFGGGLVGVNGGIIDRSSSSATVGGSVTGSILGNSVGGLVGMNYGGQITNSYATGVTTGGPSGTGGPINNGGDAGGLAGSNAPNDNIHVDGVISNSYATGNATGGSGTTGGFLGGGGRGGGLVGTNSGTITSSYATGNAVGGLEIGTLLGGYAGGLVGYNPGTIRDSYATGSATGGAGRTTKGGPAGGLVGYNGSVISNSYATGLVTGGAGGANLNFGRTGGLVGDSNASPGNVTGNYWDVTTTGKATDFYTAGVTGLTTVQWLTLGPVVPDSASGWNATTTWLQGYPYPVLRALPYIRVSASAAGVYGGTLAITQSGVTAADQNGADALGRINISGIALVGGSTAAVATLPNLGGRGVTMAAPRLYQIVYAPITATVGPAPLTFSVANASSTYGTLATPGAATLTGFVGSDASSVAGTVGVNDGVNPITLATDTDAGAYNEIVTGLTGAKASSYVVAGTGNTIGVLTINPLAVTLTGTRLYDGSAVVAGEVLVAGGTIGGDSVTFSGSAALAAKDVGSRAITSTTGLIASDTNYTATGSTGSVVITPLGVILTGSRAYDGSAIAAGGILSASNMAIGDSLTFGGAATLAARDAGLQAIVSTAGLTLSDTNYTLAGATGSVLVNPRAVTLTGTRAYDGTAVIAGGLLVAGGLIGNDSLTFGGSADLAARDAGSQAIVSAAGLSFSNANYTAAGSTGSVLISPLGVTLSGTRIYDGSATISGGALVAGGLIGDDSLTFGGSGTLAAKDAGRQAIVSTAGLTLSNGNYSLTGATGSVLIDPLSVILTGTRTYDGSAVIAGGVLRASNLVSGDSLTFGGSGMLAAKDVGPEAIVSTAGLTVSNANYTLAGAAGSVAIDPAILTVTANNLVIRPGATPPPFTVGYSGFMGSDTLDLVQGLSITSDAATFSTPGVFTIVPSGATAANYELAFVNGVLVIQAPGNAVAGQFLASIEADLDQPAAEAAAITSGSAAAGTCAVTLLDPDGGPGAVLLISDRSSEGGGCD